MPTPHHDHAASWLAAARTPAVAVALEAIFDDARAAIAARGPVCWASGRCCNFEATGHRLYVTGLEAAYTISRLDSLRPLPRRDLSAVHEGWTPGKDVSLPQVASARARGGCPFQQLNLCGVHEIKPVACRVYFCDRSAQTWQHDLAERLHERVRRLHDEHGIGYVYAEWRGLLEMVIAARSGE